MCGSSRGAGGCENESTRVGEGKRDPGACCLRDPAMPLTGLPGRTTPPTAACWGVIAKLAFSSTLLAGMPLPRREWNHLIPSCSQQPPRDVLSSLTSSTVSKAVPRAEGAA